MAVPDGCYLQNATPDNPLGTPNLDPLCAASAVVDSKVTEMMNDWRETIEGWFGAALGTMVKATATSWMNITTPGLTLGEPTGNVPSEVVSFMMGLTLWMAGSMLIAGLIWGFGKMAVTGQAEHGIEAGKGLVSFMLAAGLGAGAIGILVKAADSMSDWIIEQATGTDFATGMARMVIDSGGLAFILIIGFSILGLFTTGIQIILLIWRGGALVVLTGCLAWAASMSTTPAGKAMFHKYLGWLVAYILYKPVAALFYAAAFKLMTTGGVPGDTDRTIEHISGMALMMLALVALPAMIRLVAPITAAVASGRGSGSMLSAAAMAVLPMGAMAVAARGASGGAGAAGAAGAAGGGGGSGPTGAAGAAGGAGGPGPTGGGGPGPSGGQGAPGGGGQQGAGGNSGSHGSAPNSSGGGSSGPRNSNRWPQPNSGPAPVTP